MRTRVMIESPFAGDVARNSLYLRRATLDSIRRGEAPFAMHRMYTDALDDTIPAQRQIGLECGATWIFVATKVIFYVDYGMSPGMQFADGKAKEIGIPTETRRIGENP